MAYNNLIPQATDDPANSQVQILDNFAAIKTLVDVDHATFDTPLQGKHNKVSLPVQAADPVPLAGEGCIYNKLFAATGKNETYIHNQTQAGTSNIPFSASVLSNTVSANGNVGWTYLPSGIQMRWEVTAAAFNGLTTYTVNPAYPAFTNIFAVIVCPLNNNPAAQTVPVRLVDILSNTQFRLFSNGNTFAYMLIIGV